jgi:hypothetical protein
VRRCSIGATLGAVLAEIRTSYVPTLTPSRASYFGSLVCERSPTFSLGHRTAPAGPNAASLGSAHQHARRLYTLGLDCWVEPIRHCRTVGEAPMVRNDAPPEIRVSIQRFTSSVSTLCIVTGQVDPTALVSLMRSARAAYPTVLAGATKLPYGCGTAVRLLGTDSTAVQAALRSAWSPRAPGAARFTRAKPSRGKPGTTRAV